MTHHSKDLADEIIAAYQALYRELQTATISVWIDLNLSMAQLKTLFVVAREGPTAVGQVAEALRVGMPTASHLIDRLVQEGLVERTIDSTDRRRTLVELSPDGKVFVQRLREGSSSRLRMWVEALDEADRAALAAGLGAIVRVATAPSNEDSAIERSSVE